MKLVTSVNKLTHDYIRVVEACNESTLLFIKRSVPTLRVG